MKYIITIALSSALTISCVPNVTCDPNSGTKKEHDDFVKVMVAYCISAYTSGDLTPTVANDPKYADPALAAARAQENLNTCLLIPALMGSSSGNPNYCP